MPGNETFVLCSSKTAKSLYSIDSNPIWSFRIRDYDIENTTDDMVICGSVKVVVRFGMSANLNITHEFIFHDGLLGFSPSTDLQIDFARPVRYFSISCDTKWCFGISLNENTTIASGQSTSPYFAYNNNATSDKRWYDRNISERLITDCTILLPIPYLTAKVRTIYIRAAESPGNINGYNIGKSNRNMEINIRLNNPLRMPHLDIFILRNDFKLERLTWPQFLTIFDRNSVVYQRHSYITEYGT
jgi:hypothetical protein